MPYRKGKFAFRAAATLGAGGVALGVGHWTSSQWREAIENQHQTRRAEHLKYRWALNDRIEDDDSGFSTLVRGVNLIMINNNYALSEQSSEYLEANVRRLRAGEYTQSKAHWQEVKHWWKLYLEKDEYIYLVGVAANGAGTLFGSAIFPQKGFEGVDGSDAGYDALKAYQNLKESASIV